MQRWVDGLHLVNLLHMLLQTSLVPAITASTMDASIASAEFFTLVHLKSWDFQLTIHTCGWREFVKEEISDWWSSCLWNKLHLRWAAICADTHAWSWGVWGFVSWVVRTLISTCSRRTILQSKRQLGVVGHSSRHCNGPTDQQLCKPMKECVEHVAVETGECGCVFVGGGKVGSWEDWRPHKKEAEGSIYTCLNTLLHRRILLRWIVHSSQASAYCQLLNGR